MNIHSLKYFFRFSYCSLAVFLSLSLFSEKVFSQTKIDTLEHELNITNTDSERVVVMNKLASAYFQTGIAENLPKAESLNVNATELARKISYNPGLAAALLLHAKILINKKTELDQAVVNLLDASSLFEELKDSVGVAKCYLQFGLMSYLIQYYEDAIKSLDESIKYNKNSDLNKGLANYLTALCYLEQKKRDNAYKFFENALAIYKNISYKNGIIESYIYMAKMYVQAGNAEMASSCFQKLDSLTTFSNDDQSFGRLLAIKAGAYNLTGDYDKAITTALQAISIGKTFNDDITTREADEHLYKAYHKKGDYKKSLMYLEELNTLSDSLYSRYVSQHVAETKIKSEYEKEMFARQKLQEQKNENTKREIERQKVIQNIELVGLILLVLFSTVIFYQRRKLFRANKRNEDLLLNILPHGVAEELKDKEQVHAQQFDLVSVLFADIKDFTKISASLTANELVTEIDFYFSEFDRIISKFNIEKIKTIGDAYMCASGVPRANASHAVELVAAALEIQNFISETAAKRNAEGKNSFQLRIGIHSGPVVAGVVGMKKFAYDIWGDTVNIASRMESTGESGKVNISGTTYELVKHKFNCTYRGKLEVRNHGQFDMYFVDGARA